MYLLFHYLNYIISSYYGMRSQEKFRNQIHKLENADKLSQLGNKSALTIP